MDFSNLLEKSFLHQGILFIPVSIHRNPFCFPTYLPSSSSKKIQGLTVDLPKNKLEYLTWMARETGYQGTGTGTSANWNKKELIEFLQPRVCFVRV